MAEGTHINKGAPFIASDGRRIARGQVFVPTPEDLLRKAYKIRPLVTDAPPAAPTRPRTGADLDAVTFASQAARDLARRAALSVEELRAIGGTGPDGTLRVVDVRRAIEVRAEAAARDQRAVVPPVPRAAGGGADAAD